MPFTTFMDNAILNEFFGGSNYAPPANLHVGLSTTTPTKTGGITEPSGGGYARVPVVNNATNFPNASNGSKSNGSVITFPEASAAWGTVTHWVIYDAATGGNALVYGALGTSKAIDPGDTPSFAVGGLTVGLSQTP